MASLGGEWQAVQIMRADGTASPTCGRWCG